jgi:hypothetical protein
MSVTQGELSEKMSNKKCPHCGLINFADATECKRCKKSFDEPDATTADAAIDIQTTATEITADILPPHGTAVSSPTGTATTTQETVPLQNAKPSRHSRRWLLLLGVPLLLIAAIYGWNYLALQSPMNEVLREDARNNGISVSVHYSYYLDPSTLVFDLHDVSMTNSKADIFRVLLQYAAKMKSSHYDKVHLAFRGETKFILDGDYFQQLGQEYGAQNPVYTMRTFPSHLKRADGNEAYGSWTGGMIGVLQKEMEDFNSFHDKWYLEEMVRY